MAKDGKNILTESEISKSLARIAGEITDANKGKKELALIGILNRGFPLALRLSKLIAQGSKIKVFTGSLDVSLYRDDLAVRGKDITLKKSDIQFSIDGKTVVLIDDVLSKGRTVRAALDSLNDYGRPSCVQLAVLIDRGGRELPIQPDYAGKKISVSPNEEIAVKVKEIDGEDAAFLR